MFKSIHVYVVAYSLISCISFLDTQCKLVEPCRGLLLTRSFRIPMLVSLLDSMGGFIVVFQFRCHRALLNPTKTRSFSRNFFDAE